MLSNQIERKEVLEFRVFHGSGGADSAEKVRVSAAAEGRLPTTDELTGLLCTHLGLEDPEDDEARAETGEKSPPRRDQPRTWLLRNVSKGIFLRGDLPEIERDDVVEVMDRSVAGTSAG